MKLERFGWSQCGGGGVGRAGNLFRQATQVRSWNMQQNNAWSVSGNARVWRGKAATGMAVPHSACAGESAAD